MSQSGYNTNFYAVGLGQGGGPTVFNWGNQKNLYTSINSSYYNLVTWRGRMDNVSITPISCLGMGVDVWFDAELQNGTLLAVEMFIFFRQDGLYKLPENTFRNFGFRQDFNYSDSQMGLKWLYMYFHPWQDSIGIVSEHRFELNDYVSLLKQKAGMPYSEAQFYLTKVDVVMELFMASGVFTVDYLGLEQQLRG